MKTKCLKAVLCLLFLICVPSAFAGLNATAEEERKLQFAQASLDSEIQIFYKMLLETNHLPKDMFKYKCLFDDAHKMRMNGNASGMLSFVASMSPSLNTLIGIVFRHQEAETRLQEQIQRLEFLLSLGGSAYSGSNSNYQFLLNEARSVLSVNQTIGMNVCVNAMMPQLDELERSVIEHEKARVSLKNQIDRLDHFLTGTELVYVSEHISEYEALFSSGQEGLERDDPTVMVQLAESMSGQIDKLEEQFHINKDEALRKDLLKQNSILLFFFLVTIGLSLVLFRRGTYRSLLIQWKWTRQMWEEARIERADRRYRGLFNERTNVRALEGIEGRTGELFKNVTTEVDAIYETIQAMESHLRRCILKADQASIWRIQPLLDAIGELESVFQFDTGEINRDDLFGSQTKVIEVNPAEFQKSLEERFNKTMPGWILLKQAADAVSHTARELFPHAVMDQLLADAKKHGIPEQWFSALPFVGNDISYAKLWDELDVLRKNDPCAFVERVDELLEIQQLVVCGLELLIDALALQKKSSRL